MPLKRYLQARRRTLSIAILLAGLVAGILLYLAAAPQTEDLLASEANESKRYARQMEEYGGASNLVANDIREWFSGLWQGRELGITVACLSAIAAAGVFVALTPID